MMLGAAKCQAAPPFNATDAFLAEAVIEGYTQTSWADCWQSNLNANGRDAKSMACNSSRGKWKTVSRKQYSGGNVKWHMQSASRGVKFTISSKGAESISSYRR